MQSVSAGSATGSSQWVRRWALIALTTTYVLNTADRSILNVAGEAIRVDLHLDDKQMGLLAGVAFFILNSLATLPIAWFADRANRIKLISIALGIWSLMTALCGLANSFWQMFALRAGVGISEAGGPFPAQSVMSDYYPLHERARAVSIFSLGAPLGVLVAAFGCGALVQEIGWRLTFLALGIPGMALAFIIFFTTREPAHGQSDESKVAVAPQSFLETLRRLKNKPTYFLFTFGVAVQAFASLALLQFLHPYMVREFNIGYRDAALIFGLVNAVPTILGAVVSGELCKRLTPRDLRYYAWIPAIGFFITAPLLFLAFQQQSWLLFMVFIFGAFIGTHMYFGPFVAVIHHFAGPRGRTMTAAASGLIYYIIGSFGPFVGGYISDSIASSAMAPGVYQAKCIIAHAPELAAACKAASGNALGDSLMIMSSVFLFAAILFLLPIFTIRKDMASVSST